MSWPPLTRDQDRLLTRLHKMYKSPTQVAQRMKLPIDQIEHLMVELDCIQDMAREKRNRAALEKANRPFLAAFQQRRQSRSQEESPAP